MIIKFFKFGAVGFSGLLIDFGFTYFFKDVLKSNKYIANSIGFSLAATNNYILNRIWTFNSADPDILAQFLKFFGISVIGLLLNNMFVWIFHDKIKLNFYFSKLMAIGCVLFWNFFANYIYTFTS
ncbi:MAG TPA: glycosyl transferase family 2 [Cytophagales bacterium]|nr:glycosyl transferase family 2 [Cytophagales bacterium]